jgi:hypothetical protein
MPALIVRGLTIVALTVGIGHAAPAAAQTIAGSRTLTLPVEPITPTRIETLLATPNLMLVADYYRIDMRFGPALRIDALVVEIVDSRTRMKGLRVQVRDPESRGRQQGESFIDVDELAGLSRALSAMSELSARWTHDDRQATEMAFTTSGGFRIAIRQSARIPRTYLSTGLLDPVVTSIDLAELPTIKHAFDQAIALLNSK